MNIVVLTLLLLVFLQTCKKDDKEVPAPPKVTRDTVWVVKDSVIHSKPQIIERISVPIEYWSTEYLPDTNYDKLLKQYTELAEKFLASNIQKDSVKIDSIGYVSVTDTVSRNLIIGRTTSYNLKYPIIKETITLPEKKRNQIYVGGLLQGNSAAVLNQITAAALLKTKKDQIYGATVGIDTRGQILYGGQIYWKLKLKK